MGIWNIGNNLRIEVIVIEELLTKKSDYSEPTEYDLIEVTDKEGRKHVFVDTDFGVPYWREHHQDIKVGSRIEIVTERKIKSAKILS